MIDKVKVKKFWNDRIKNRKGLKNESLANLEEDSKLLSVKVRLEQEQVLPRLHLNKNMNVLDLGAGYGQWAFRFAPIVHSVTAVEFSHTFIRLGEKEAQSLGIDNVYFIESAAEEFKPETTWDLVFISGLFIYLNDDQANAVADIAVKALQKGGKLFLRDSTSIINKRYIIDDSWSERLKCFYSAIYRTRYEYITMFLNRGLSLLEDSNMFAEDNILNKYSETRLRFYVFKNR